jgi:hypothetical protein
VLLVESDDCRHNADDIARFALILEAALHQEA